MLRRWRVAYLSAKELPPGYVAGWYVFDYYGNPGGCIVIGPCVSARAAFHAIKINYGNIMRLG